MSQWSSSSPLSLKVSTSSSWRSGTISLRCPWKDTVNIFSKVGPIVQTYVLDLDKARSTDCDVGVVVGGAGVSGAAD